MPPISGVFFTPDGAPLSFYVEARDDTVLLVNTPDGEWHCNDDYSGLNPALTFEAPQEGQYDIWVGTYSATNGDYPPATLAVTQSDPFAAASSAPSSARTTVSPWTRPNRHGP
jgi:hypothetical protein